MAYHASVCQGQCKKCCYNLSQLIFNRRTGNEKPKKTLEVATGCHGTEDFEDCTTLLLDCFVNRCLMMYKRRDCDREKMVFCGMELAQFSVSCFFLLFHFNCKSGMRQAEIILHANYMAVLRFVVGFLILPFTFVFCK